MFIAKNNDLIVMAADTQAELLQKLVCMVYTEILETTENYILHNGQYLTESEALVELKKQKQQENQKALDVARTSHTFVVTLQNQECEFDTKDKTQSDLNSAAIASGMGQPWLWTTNNRITLSLTAEDIQVVSAAYMQAVNADIAKWTAFEEQIEQAETIVAVENIEIEY
nr:MAG TPA: protein of unknown function (DUF4376) [Caudoviricetes sp.]